MQRRLQRLGYGKARALLLGAGLAVLGLIAVLTYVRGVEPVEVAGTLLFIPIFVAMVLWGVRGGIVAAVLAAVAYGVMRMPAIEAVGGGRFAGVIAARAAAYLAFGAIGGWAARALESSILKLELYDHVDDATGLHNARFFVQETDLEASRAKRYETMFSVSVVDIEREVFDADGRRGRRALRELGRAIAAGIRTVDRAVHVEGGDKHRFAVILPETGKDGATVFTDRLARQLVERLSPGGREVTPERTIITIPGDDEALATVRAEFAALDRIEHPETRATGG